MVGEVKEEEVTIKVVVCPCCGERQFSPFDQEYTLYYRQCVDCTPQWLWQERFDKAADMLDLS